MMISSVAFCQAPATTTPQNPKPAVTFPPLIGNHAKIPSHLLKDKTPLQFFKDRANKVTMRATNLINRAMNQGFKWQDHVVRYSCTIKNNQLKCLPEEEAAKLAAAKAAAQKNQPIEKPASSTPKISKEELALKELADNYNNACSKFKTDTAKETCINYYKSRCDRFDLNKRSKCLAIYQTYQNCIHRGCARNPFTRTRRHCLLGCTQQLSIQLKKQFDI